MDIVIIGSGNVAHVLGRLAVQAGHVVKQVAGRNRREVEALANRLHREGCEPLPSTCVLRPAPCELQTASLYLICISDTALENLHQWFHHDKAILVHTAGSVSKDVLAPAAKNYGVLWPLQSLRKEAEAIPPMPLVVDANTVECLTVIQDFAASLSSSVHIMDDETRRKMHLAAVVSGNFSNHLLAMVYDYCKAEGLDPALLVPLLEETVGRMAHVHPADMQTGPAIRADHATLQKHEAMLFDYPALKKLYHIFSDLIQTKQLQ